jgi:hypothetical protein
VSSFEYSKETVHLGQSYCGFVILGVPDWVSTEVRILRHPFNV